MRYKIGDKVLIRKPDVCHNWNPEMCKWEGKIMTIRKVLDDSYKMEEDTTEHRGDGWFWNPEMILSYANCRNQLSSINIFSDTN